MLVRSFPSLGRAVPQALVATRSCRSASQTGLAPAARCAAQHKGACVHIACEAGAAAAVRKGGGTGKARAGQKLTAARVAEDCPADLLRFRLQQPLLLLHGARVHLRDGGVLRRLGQVGVRERLPSQRSARGEVSSARPGRGRACDAAVGGRARTMGGRARRAESLGVAYLG